MPDAAQKEKLTRRRRLDNLLDWYDEHKPGEIAEVPVGVTRGTVLRWGIRPEKRGGPLLYRNRTIVPKRKRGIDQ